MAGFSDRNYLPGSGTGTGAGGNGGLGELVTNGVANGILYVDGSGNLAELVDAAGLGSTGVTIGRLKIAEHTSDNVYLGHYDHNSGTTIYAIWMQPDGDLVLNAVTAKAIDFRIANVSKAFINATDFEMAATLFLKWSATNEQTTVGAAGAASALPATPTKYFKVHDSAGTVLIIPAYAAS